MNQIQGLAHATNKNIESDETPLNSRERITMEPFDCQHFLQSTYDLHSNDLTKDDVHRNQMDVSSMLVQDSCVYTDQSETSVSMKLFHRQDNVSQLRIISYYYNIGKQGKNHRPRLKRRMDQID